MQLLVTRPLAITHFFRYLTHFFFSILKINFEQVFETFVPAEESMNGNHWPTGDLITYFASVAISIFGRRTG